MRRLRQASSFVSWIEITQPALLAAKNTSRLKSQTADDATK
jgi:hypothetical protein